MSETIEGKAMRLFMSACEQDAKESHRTSTVKMDCYFINMLTRTVELAIAEEREACGWRDIESAPKGLTSYIWLGAPGNLRVGYWHIDYWADKSKAENLASNTSLDFIPTLWHPCPIVPKDEVGE
jgi:hypothetical protein